MKRSSAKDKPVAAVAPLSKEEADEAAAMMEEMKPHIGFNGYVIGVGQRNRRGQFEPLRAMCDEVKQEFIDGYSGVSANDTVGQLFAHQSTLVLAVSCLDYPTSKAGRGQMGAYLRDHGVAHVLLAGVESSYGMAWVTMCRMLPEAKLKALAEEYAKAYQNPTNAAQMRAETKKKLGPGFNAAEAEIASYLLRAKLFTWQRNECERSRGKPSLDEARYRMLDINSREQQVALRLARGWTQDQIAKGLAMSVATVKKHSAAVKEALAEEWKTDPEKQAALKKEAANKDAKKKKPVGPTVADIADRLLGKLR